MMDRDMAIFAYHPDPRTSCPSCIEQRKTSFIEFGNQARERIRPEPLRVVVEMREINQCQVGMILIQYLGCTATDP